MELLQLRARRATGERTSARHIPDQEHQVALRKERRTVTNANTQSSTSFGFNAADAAEQARKFEYWGIPVRSKVVQETTPTGKTTTNWMLYIKGLSVLFIDSATKQPTERIMRLRIQDGAGRQISKESPAALMIRKWKELGANFGPQGDNANAPIEFVQAHPGCAIRFNAYFMPTGGLIKEGARAGQPYGEFVEEPVGWDPNYTPPANISSMEVKIPDFMREAGNDPATQGVQATAQPVSAQLSPEDLDVELVELFDGRATAIDSETMQLAMTKFGANPSLLQEIVTGAAAKRLVEEGKLTVAGDVYAAGV